MARIPKRYPKAPPPFLTRLPGEIRNKIYELCILSALKEPPKTYNRRFSPLPNITPADPLSLLKVTALPRWSGPGLFRLEGIGALPFLFVSKQAHKEIISLLYSMVQGVSIGGYVLQRPGEDSSVRWECAYMLMRARPDLLSYTKHLTIMLPCVREAVFRGRWTELSMKDRATNVESKPWLMLPGLVAFLGTFTSLCTLKIVVTADGAEPPNFEELLPLYDICGHGTAIEVVAPNSVASWVALVSPWANRWTDAWAECLIKHGRI